MGRNTILLYLMVFPGCLTPDRRSSATDNTYCYSNLEDWAIAWELSPDKRLCLNNSGYCEHAMAGTPSSECDAHNRSAWEQDKAAMTAKEPWVRFAPADSAFSQPLAVKAAFVRPQLLAKALETLADRSFLQLDAHDTTELADLQGPTGEGSYYLLRAVTCEGARRDMELRINTQGDLQLTTYGFTMGGTPRIPHVIARDAVVAELTRAPRELFVDCHTHSDL